jgi:hypothetical protein
VFEPVTHLAETLKTKQMKTKQQYLRNKKIIKKRRGKYACGKTKKLIH